MSLEVMINHAFLDRRSSGWHNGPADSISYSNGLVEIQRQSLEGLGIAPLSSDILKDPQGSISWFVGTGVAEYINLRQIPNPMNIDPIHRHFSVYSRSASQLGVDLHGAILYDDGLRLTKRLRTPIDGAIMSRTIAGPALVIYCTDRFDDIAEEFSDVGFTGRKTFGHATFRDSRDMRYVVADQLVPYRVDDPMILALPHEGMFRDEMAKTVDGKKVPKTFMENVLDGLEAI